MKEKRKCGKRNVVSTSPGNRLERYFDLMDSVMSDFEFEKLKRIILTLL